METIKTGERAVCSQCGEDIEFAGKYWQHVKTNPRHMGIPENSTTKQLLRDIDLMAGYSEDKEERASRLRAAIVERDADKARIAALETFLCEGATSRTADIARAAIAATAPKEAE